LSPIQRRFFEHDIPERHHYNQAVLLEVSRDVDAAVIEQALSALVAHHDALRHRFERRGTGWTQEVGPPDGTVTLERFDLAALTEESRAAAFEQGTAELQGRLDLSRGPLFRAGLFDLGPAEPFRLLLVSHHLVVDGVSWRILLEDLATATDQLRRGEPVRLPAKTSSFKAWAETLARVAHEPGLRDELEHWLRETEPDGPGLAVDGDTGLERQPGALGVDLDTESTRVLIDTFGRGVRDALVAALIQTMNRWTGRTTLRVNLEGHGREPLSSDLEVDRTVGWFTAVFPVRFDLDGTSGADEVLARVSDTLGRVPGGGRGYGLLRYLAEPETVDRLRGRREPEVLFNYLGRVDETLAGSGPFSLAREGTGPSRSAKGRLRHAFEVNVLIAGGVLRTLWLYDRGAHRPETVETLADGFHEALRSLMEGAEESDDRRPADEELTEALRQVDFE
jgi:non-ribosomal peptide synthase protein (TIGR01720 family)